MSDNELIKIEEIKSRIYPVRGIQVMIDSDLADLYRIEVKILNRAVKRNIERFPAEFMFQMTADEYNFLRSQTVTLKNQRYLRFQIGTSNNNESLKSQIVTSNQRGGRRYLPYAFTEQGVAMLSAVLRSETAVKTSIQIINAFVGMRRFIAANAQVFHRLDEVERKQIEYKTDSDRKFEKIFNAIEERSIKPKQGVFFDGQVFDAYQFISDLIRSAEKSIVLIDNYTDDTVLTHLTKRKKKVKATVLTKSVSKQLALDLKKFNEQYPPVEIKEFKHSHDRFLIIDNQAVYHFGASLKDLGKKWFAFSKMDIGVVKMLRKLEHIGKES